MLGAPVLAAAQLNRLGARITMTPTIAELAQSDAIGQDSDFVLMQRRMAGPVTVNTVAKNRHGLDGVMFWTKFDPDYGQFREITREQAEDLCDDQDESR
jgi:replicative DNA helicase